MSHPDPLVAPDLTPVEIGEVWENPVTRELLTTIELPWANSDDRLVAELVALVGARVAGEHRHPGISETFTALEGELTLKLDGKERKVSAGETVTIPPDTWHDWWNATDSDVRVRVEVQPGERFLSMIETVFGLGRAGHLDKRGMPNPLQLALIANEFSDVIVMRKPPPQIQRFVFKALSPVARARGYRATYPQFSRSTLAPRD